MKGEIIPDGEFLYRYVNPDSFPDDQLEVPFSIFIDEQLSCDWAKFQKYPEYSLHISEGRTVIVEISVCEAIRNPRNPKQLRHAQPTWHQDIVHDPILKGEDPFHPTIANQSHSLIKGKKTIHITKAIADNCKFVKKVNPETLPPQTFVDSGMHAIKKKFVTGLLFALGLIFLIALLIYIL